MIFIRILSIAAISLALAGFMPNFAPIADASHIRPSLEGQNFEIDLQSNHGWCTGGPCSFSSGDYRTASVAAYTLAPAHVNHRVSTPDEVSMLCEHTYSDASGRRHDDLAQVRAFTNDAGTPVHGSIDGTVGIPSPDSGRTSQKSSGFLDVTVHDSGPVFGFDGQMHMMSAVGRASGTQITDNTYRRGTLLGGMHITIIGTVLRYHQATGPSGSTWVFDGAPNLVTACTTTNVPAGFQYDGNSIYDHGAH